MWIRWFSPRSSRRFLVTDGKSIACRPMTKRTDKIINLLSRRRACIRRFSIRRDQSQSCPRGQSVPTAGAIITITTPMFSHFCFSACHIFQAIGAVIGVYLQTSSRHRMNLSLEWVCKLLYAYYTCLVWDAVSTPDIKAMSTKIKLRERTASVAWTEHLNAA